MSPEPRKHLWKGWNTLERIQAVFDLCVVIFTGALVWTSYEQWQITRESMQSVQRAFVVSKDVAPSRHIINDKSGERAIWSFTMPWENTGTTPGIITSQAFFQAPFASEPTEEQFARRPLAQSAIMGLKAVRAVGNVTASDIDIFGFELPHLDADVIKMPIHTLTLKGPRHIFWGWVTYRDVFSRTPLHLTEFCEAMIGAVMLPDNPASPLGFFWLPCDHHNCADEHCDDYKGIVALAQK
jgi:hypothetical protein